MKAFMKQTGEWIEIRFSSGTRRFEDLEGTRLSETSILKISAEPNEFDYVVCSTCGRVFPNKKEILDAHTHRDKPFDLKECRECALCAKERMESITKEEHYDEEGNLTVTSTNKFRLMCTARYIRVPIKEVDWVSYCTKFRCYNATFTPVTNFFIDRPNVFDVIATTNSLPGKTWTKEPNGKYKRKARCSIYAQVNNKEMITGFEVYYRRACYYLAYSATEKKWYRNASGTYLEGLPYALENSEYSVKLLDTIAKEIYGA